MPANRQISTAQSAAPIVLGASLWLSPDKLRNHMDAAQTGETYRSAAEIPSRVSPRKEQGHQTTAVRPKAKCRGAHRFDTPSRVVRLLAEMFASDLNSRIAAPRSGVRFLHTNPFPLSA